MATYGYIRVSTEEQAGDDRTSLEEQRRRIEGISHANGWTLDAVFEEKGVSGGKPMAERPEGGRLLRTLAPGDRLVASKLDRMFRSAADALAVTEAMQKRDVQLYLLDIGIDPVTTSITGRLFFSIVAAFAEFERGRIKERLRESIAARRRAGRKISGIVPFGFTEGQGKQVAEDPKQQAAIATIRGMRADNASLRAIRDAVAEQHGLKVSHVTINAVLLRGKGEVNGRETQAAAVA